MKLRWRCPQCRYREIDAIYLGELIAVDGALLYEYRCANGHIFAVRFDQYAERARRGPVRAVPTP